MAPTSPLSTMRAPVLLDQTGMDNPAGLAAADVQALLAGGPMGSSQWLYPYDGTVFPRGMLAPTLMWNGAAPDAVYVHIRSQYFEYKSVLRPGAAPDGPSVDLPQDVWDKAGQQSAGPSDVYTLEVTTRAAGAVAGPMTVHFNIAQATIKGSIYYNTYSTRLPGAALGGNVLRIPPGGAAELFLSTDCNGCHSVSADGSRMLSQVGLVIGGSSFPIAVGSMANPAGMPAGPRTAFAAIYPDGSKYLATSVEIEVARARLTQGAGGPIEATLYDSNSGQVVPDTGIPTGALMPNFSPDGKQLVFNDNAIDMAHGLALMTYDTTTHKASGYRMLTQEPAGATRPAWPFFLPDGKAVIFIRTDATDFSGSGAGLNGVLGLAPASDLYVVDLASGKSTLLAQAMGFRSEADAASGKSYLPFPEDELHHSYFPTVSPVAAGGYFWVFFDAVHHYGNRGLQRQIWGTAITIQADGSYTEDPSHPAFYVPGQEFATGNHRAFAALDPCKKDGETCTSGIDCCGGSCIFPEEKENVDQVGVCGPPPPNKCAMRDERCKLDTDCCPPAPNEAPIQCIAGFCSVVPLN
jgi:hypothetical protein